MSRVISRQVRAPALRVIIDLEPGETLLVVKSAHIPNLRLADGDQIKNHVPIDQIITVPEDHAKAV